MTPRSVILAGLSSLVLASGCADLHLVPGPGGAAGASPSTGGASSSTASSTGGASSSTSGTGGSMSSSTSAGCPSAGDGGASSSTSSSSGAPTILVGSSELGSNVDPHPGGTANVNSYHAAESGTVGHISVWLVSGSAAVVFLGLYSDKSGTPDALLSVGKLDPDWANVNGGAWRTAAVSPAVAVTQGQAYWIAILSPAGGGDVNFGYYTNGTDAWSSWEHSASTVLTGLPCTWEGATGPNFNSTECSMYASP